MDKSPYLLRIVPEEQNQASRLSADTNHPPRLFARFNAQEARVVRSIVNRCQRYPRLSIANAVLNLMGNGLLYLILAVSLPLFEGWRAWRFMVAAALSAAVAHLFYPLLKSRLARLRPYDFDPTLRASIKALDKYSCPSGHCMTATAVGIPLVLAFPVTLMPAVVIWLMIAWSRISLGHHYPTDLLLGGIMGAVISLPISIFICG